MDIDIEELLRIATSTLNLKDFKGDVVALKVVENEIGNIEPGGVGVQHVHYHSDKVMCTEKSRHPMQTPDKTSTPSKLQSPEANELWEKAEKEGWVNADHQPLISKPKAAILASVMADLLQMQPRWAAFEQLWGIDELANQLSRAQNCVYYDTTMKDMEKALA